MEVKLNGNLTISSGTCSSYTADFNLTICNGYGTLDQLGSDDINVGVCKADDGTCKLSQETPSESYDCTFTSEAAGTCTNTYSTCTYDVTLTPISTVSIPECKTVSVYPSSTDNSDPVNTSTGELFFDEIPDLSLSGGPRPLSFVRYYASHLVVGGYGDSHLGNNWAHNFGWRFDNRGADASINTPKGRIITFSKSDSLWALWCEAT